MKLVASIFILFVAVLHTGFLVLEMFFWDHDFGRNAFNLTPELSKDTVMMAKNQGLYNGFLVAGLLWGLIVNKVDVKTFFLACVIVAGVFGAITVKPSIFFIQALPAMIALVILWLSEK